MQTKIIILAGFVLILANVTNAFIDAYKITVLKKAIRHAINLTAYLVVTGLCVWLFNFPLWHAVLYVVSAFFCRQITFDIPLNLRRDLKWDYVSMAMPPQAIMDRIEVKIFGYNGKAPTVIYGVIWIISLTAQFIL